MAKILDFPSQNKNEEFKIKFTLVQRLPGGIEMHSYSFKPYSCLEDYLLKKEVTGFRKFKARLFGEAYLGEFKLQSNEDRFRCHYLIWCPVHHKYDVSFYHSHDEILVCRDCERERINKIFQPDKNNIEDEDLF